MMVFDMLFERMLRTSRERLFRRLIDIEFLNELTFAYRLAAIPYVERTPNQNFLENYLREKYPLSGKCPSELYLEVSKPLRREYNVIHRQLMGILYPLNQNNN